MEEPNVVPETMDLSRNSSPDANAAEHSKSLPQVKANNVTFMHVPEKTIEESPAPITESPYYSYFQLVSYFLSII